MSGISQTNWPPVTVFGVNYSWTYSPQLDTDWPQCSAAHPPTSGLDPEVKQHKCATEEEAGRQRTTSWQVLDWEPWFWSAKEAQVSLCRLICYQFAFLQFALQDGAFPKSTQVFCYISIFQGRRECLLKERPVVKPHLKQPDWTNLLSSYSVCTNQNALQH